jgi:hypothetical protein
MGLHGLLLTYFTIWSMPTATVANNGEKKPIRIQSAFILSRLTTQKEYNVQYNNRGSALFFAQRPTPSLKQNTSYMIQGRICSARTHGGFICTSLLLHSAEPEQIVSQNAINLMDTNTQDGPWRKLLSCREAPITCKKTRCIAFPTQLESNYGFKFSHRMNCCNISNLY